MNGTRAGRGIFAKLLRALAKAAGRLAPHRGAEPYRPEKHYMRGPGPKSRSRATTGGGRTPNPT